MVFYRQSEEGEGAGENLKRTLQLLLQNVHPHTHATISGRV